MTEHAPNTLTLTISDVKNRLSRLFDQVSNGESRILVEKTGVPIAAIVSVDDLRRLRQFEQQREEFFLTIDRVQESFADVPAEEIEQETDRIIARNRATDRAARDELVVTR